MEKRVYEVTTNELFGIEVTSVLVLEIYENNISMETGKLGQIIMIYDSEIESDDLPYGYFVPYKEKNGFSIDDVIKQYYHDVASEDTIILEIKQLTSIWV
ncbi:MAG: hypothetical protein K2M17_00945 [Bacilli bacterium]|nr:hypothetical protein [Bacilli bacterium]